MYGESLVICVHEISAVIITRKPVLLHWFQTPVPALELMMFLTFDIDKHRRANQWDLFGYQQA